jgi:uncharacterized peroxidase-related enzyme
MEAAYHAPPPSPKETAMPQPDHVMALDLPYDESTLGDEERAYFAKCREKLGMVPNVLQAYAHNPRKLRTFIALYNELMLGDSSLSKLEREMIAVVTSSANHCFYCLVAHGQAVRRLSEDPHLGEMMVMNYRVADLPARQRAMLDFAWELTLRPSEITDAHRAALREAGLSEQGIFDLADVVGFFNMSNRVALATDMLPNPEYHALNRA